LRSGAQISGNIGKQISDRLHADHLTVLGQSFAFRKDPALLDRKLLVSKIVKFNKIASLEFYTHSAIQPGMFLDSVGSQQTVSAWRPFDKDIGGGIPTSQLREHFTDDAYAFVYGCNGAHLLAPWLASQWNIPVAGSFTSTYIQTASLISNAGVAENKKYAYDYSDRFAETARMKSDKIVYDLSYGKYDVIFPAFRFFCSNPDSSRCAKGIGKSILTTVSPIVRGGDRTSVAQQKDLYHSIIREWLCPTDIGQRDTENSISCIEVLTKATSYIEAGQTLPDSLGNYMPVGEREQSLDCEVFAATCYDPICSTDRTYSSWEYKSASDPTGESTRKELFLASACVRNEQAVDGKPPVRLVPRKQVALADSSIMRRRVPLGAASFMAEYSRLIRTFDAVQGEIPATFWTS
jgi:hypothetical protein